MVRTRLWVFFGSLSPAGGRWCSVTGLSMPVSGIIFACDVPFMGVTIPFVGMLSPFVGLFRACDAH